MHTNTVTHSWSSAVTVPMRDQAEYTDQSEMSMKNRPHAFRCVTVAIQYLSNHIDIFELCTQIEFPQWRKEGKEACSTDLRWSMRMTSLPEPWVVSSHSPSCTWWRPITKQFIKQPANHRSRSQRWKIIHQYIQIVLNSCCNYAMRNFRIIKNRDNMLHSQNIPKTVLVV